MATSSRTGCASKRPLGCAAAGSAGCTSPPPLWAFHWLADLILWGSKSLLPRQLLLRTGAPVLGVCGSLVAAFPSSQCSAPLFGPQCTSPVYVGTKSVPCRDVPVGNRGVFLPVRFVFPFLGCNQLRLDKEHYAKPAHVTDTVLS